MDGAFMDYILSLSVLAILLGYTLFHLFRKRRKRLYDSQPDIPPLPFILGKNRSDSFTNKQPVFGDPDFIEIYPAPISKTK